MYDRSSTVNQLGAFALLVEDTVNAALAEKFSRTRSELETLVSVRHCDTFTIGRLSNVLNLSHSAAVRIADRLQNDELIQRTQQSNRRFVGLVLTGNGTNLADEILQTRQETLEDLFKGSDDEELSQTLSMIQRVLGQVSDSELASYRCCRLCHEQNCGTSCPGIGTFGSR